ncbi:MAG: hypothetical protein KAI44_04265, partial [Methylococcales bacterium]|nr:hypothetical protein [Methylococcales bacterium]
PFIASAKTLLPENQERLGIDWKACLANLEILKNNSKIRTVVTDVFQQEREFDSQGNVDAMLYDGFFSSDDKRAFVKIRRTAPEQLSILNLSISDKRFKELFFRYRARNFPESLSNDEKGQWEKYRHSVLAPIASDYFSTLDSFAEQFKDDDKNRKIINSLHEYAKTIAGQEFL